MHTSSRCVCRVKINNSQGNMALPTGEDKMPETECKYMDSIDSTAIENNFQFTRIEMNFKKIKRNNTEIYWRNLAE